MILLVRDDSASPKVWRINSNGTRRPVLQQGECQMYDAINDLYWPNVAQPKYPNYPVVDANWFFAAYTT